jgi:predicted nicotinamide N-methyase
MHDSRKEIIPDEATGFVAVESASGLPELPCGWALRDYQLGTVTLKLTLPLNPDALLDDDSVRDANALDDYMPYWAYLWPAAIAMSRQVLTAPWARGTPVLELGCGVGLVGLAALSIGCRVTLTDYDPLAIAVADYNAKLNGFADYEAQTLDWRQPPARRYPVILGCDLLYEERNLQPILDLLNQMLLPGGECWLADGGRRHTGRFLSLVRELGYEVSAFDADGHPTSGLVNQLQIFRMTRRPG